MNDLLMQYRKVQEQAHQSVFATHSASAAAQLQAQLGAARNGQIAEQISQMMSANQVFLGNNHMLQNFESLANGQPGTPRLNGVAPHPLQAAFDFNQQQLMSSAAVNSPATRPVGDSLPHTASAQAHASVPSVSHTPGPAQPRSASAMSHKGGEKPSAQPPAEGGGESSGAESAEDAPAGKGDRKEARKEYHKRIERKRRDRMRNLYDELRALVNPDEPADKNAVLAGAVSLIQELRDENIKLQSRVHIKEKRAKMKGDSLQIKVFKSKDADDGSKKCGEEGARMEATINEGEDNEDGQSSSGVEKPEQQGRTSGEETSEGSEQGAPSKTSDSVTEGSEQGAPAPKRQRVAEVSSS